MTDEILELNTMGEETNDEEYEDYIPEFPSLTESFSIDYDSENFLEDIDNPIETKKLSEGNSETDAFSEEKSDVLDHLKIEDLESAYNDAKENGNMDLANDYNQLLEIYSLRVDLDLDTKNEDSDIVQAGGIYKDLKGKCKDYHLHHIPAKSIQDTNMRDLPCIALTKFDHYKTDSYGYKFNKTTKSFLPDSIDRMTYKDDAKEMLEQGQYLALVRDELYNLKDQFGNKYNGGIDQYLDALNETILEKIHKDEEIQSQK